SLSSPTDQRDRRQADHPARKIARHKVGPIDIRSLGDVLQFRDAGMSSALAPRMDVERGERAADYFSELPLDITAFQSPYRTRPPRQLQWGLKSRLTRADLLQRTADGFVAGGNMVNEARSLLEKWEHFNRGKDRRREIDSPADPTEDEVSEQLM